MITAGPPESVSGIDDNGPPGRPAFMDDSSPTPDFCHGFKAAQAGYGQLSNLIGYCSEQNKQRLMPRRVAIAKLLTA